MDFKTDISFDRLVSLVQQLPQEKVAKLKAVLKGNSTGRKKSATIFFQDLLLQGPVMGNEQFENFQANRERLVAWRKK